MSSKSESSLRAQVLTLSRANAFDYLIQLALPVLLVRLLNPIEIGQYRLFWLVASAAIALAPLYMPRSLFFFLPKSDSVNKVKYVSNTLFYLAVVGLLVAVLVSPLDPFLPTNIQVLSEQEWLLSGFLFFWVSGSLIEALPNAEQHVRWQANAIVILSLTRAILIISAAWWTRDITWVFSALLLFAILKLLLLLFYVQRNYGISMLKVDLRLLKKQFLYAVPFGASTALYLLRGQADQWVAAHLFTPEKFAAFSMAAVIGPLVNLIRQSVVNALLPSMTKRHAEGDMQGALALNSKGNLVSAVVIYPILAFLFVFAEPVVNLVYTSTYLDAAQVMRVYILGLIAVSIELGSVMLVFSQGAFVMRLDFLLLIASAAGSYMGGILYGLPGAALGSVLAVYVGLFGKIYRIRSETGISMNYIQDWKGVGSSLLAALLAGSVAWIISALPAVSGGPWLQLSLGSVALFATYILGLLLLGQRNCVQALVMRRNV